jgi:hypothetical protein
MRPPLVFAGRALPLLLVLAAACSPEDAAPTATRAALPGTSAAAVTVVAPPSATPAPIATPTEAILRVETPTPPPTPTDTPPPTATPPCESDLVFLTDLTVPDGTHFLPGQPILKQWGVRNAGTCDWTGEYRLALVSGSALGPRTQAALYPARAGAEAVIELAMTAPQEPGEYTGRWQARDPRGRPFGNVIFIKIEVIPVPGEEPTPPPEEGG